MANSTTSAAAKASSPAVLAMNDNVSGPKQLPPLPSKVSAAVWIPCALQVNPVSPDSLFKFLPTIHDATIQEAIPGDRQRAPGSQA